MSSGNRDGRGGPPRGGGDYGGGGGYGSGGGYGGGRAGVGGRPRGGGQQQAQIFLNPHPQNPKVAKIEDTLHPATKKALDLSSLKLTEDFPIRPGYGTRGIKIELTANSVELLPPSNLVLFRYDVNVSPEAAGRKHTRIIQLLLESPELAPHRGSLATDFRSTFISKTKLPEDKTIVDIVYRKDGEDDPDVGAPTYKVQIQYTKSLSISELTDYLNSTNLGQSFTDKQEFTQALNIFLNHYAKSANNLAAIGSSKSFSLNQNAPRGDLGFGLEVIRGFFSSVRIATSRVLVNINVSHGAFYTSCPLPALMEKHGYLHTVALEKFLKLVRVQTTHMPEKRNKANEVTPRIKTIFGLARSDDGRRQTNPPRVHKQHGANAREVEFWLDGGATSSAAPVGETKGGGKGKGKNQPKGPAAPSSGKYITVFDFFKQTYNITLKYPNLPIVNCKTRDDPMYLPAEVCHVLQGQPSKSKLDGVQTQNMIRHAVRKPWDNATSILREGVETAGLDEKYNVLLQSFGIKVSSGLVKVPGRILNVPKVFYQGKKPIDPRLGSWNMTDFKFRVGAPVPAWSWVIISLQGKPQRDQFDLKAAEGVMGQFQAALQKIGVNAGPPGTGKHVLLQHQDDPRLDAFIQFAAAHVRLLFIILPDNVISLYKRIKTLADREHGLHTICSLASKLSQQNRRQQYMANVALKFNLKLGGVNQIVQSQSFGIIQQKKTMVVGIDVTHPSPGSSSNAPSVSAMVASIDDVLGQWPAILRVQKARQEEVNDLGEMLKSRLVLWRTKGKNLSLPENILVYRDGVSEGQYDMVISEELSQLRAACKEVYPAQDTKNGLPRFTIIVCGKRHKTRFYPTSNKDFDNSGNTKPGTVVDRGVTEARNWDFFLQAHAALQGTARPCHYYIVHDEIFRQIYAKNIPPPFQNVADIVEDLTHHMCYLFGRATKAVSLCPPAYYADLACERARCYLASLFDSPSPSAAPSVAGGQADGKAGPASKNDVQIHEKLRDTMFYI